VPDPVTGEPVAEEIMSRPVLTCTPETSLREAAARMAERNVGSIVVVEGEKPVGIITERDMVRFVAEGVPGETRVGEVMTRNLVTAGPGEAASRLLCTMLERGIRRIPIVDGEGRLLGIVSLRDLVRAEAARERLCRQG